MTTTENDEFLLKYNTFMDEILGRLEMVHVTMKGLIIPHGLFTAEICFLQLRKVCELIALACLCAHGDLGKGVERSASEKWNVRKIMKILEELDADFYPVPVTIRVDDTRVDISGPETPSPILDKKSLLRLYERSGEVLHSGSVKRYFKGREARTDVTAEIMDGMSRTIALLEQHRIFLIGFDKQLVCRMQAPPKGLAQSFIIYSPSDRL